MSVLKSILVAGMMMTGLCGCGADNDNSTPVQPEVKIKTVDELLARVCELAADCVSATPDEIVACPADLRQELDESDLSELQRFTTLAKSEQDRILACFDAGICGRFGGSLGAISDADLMEPLLACWQSCSRSEK